MARHALDYDRDGGHPRVDDDLRGVPAEHHRLLDLVPVIEGFREACGTSTTSVLRGAPPTPRPVRARTALVVLALLAGEAGVGVRAGRLFVDPRPGGARPAGVEEAPHHAGGGARAGAQVVGHRSRADDARERHDEASALRAGHHHHRLLPAAARRRGMAEAGDALVGHGLTPARAPGRPAAGGPAGDLALGQPRLQAAAHLAQRLARVGAGARMRTTSAR